MIPQAYLTGREGWRAMKLTVPYRVPEGGIAFDKNYATPSRSQQSLSAPILTVARFQSENSGRRLEGILLSVKLKFWKFVLRTDD